ncbi:methyl-accepting chemotaxis protein [Paraburkholderia caballeronis]|uniref:methyl-accepting chemotaxis protein n=1 Tax=Paraburkholderia caballeronis TaxID=416943 RepID=UPI001065E979|nr:methyl-accepting chemotaxis protein [Paraburkholderia caballeronis]TDV06813.1 methyl-accepting chemotaxis sensory transducer with Cache sensor [Paraburkholderia caballeronis]TDV09993.1 methyl-accepting chemotaxis sensory transducer with Cache sensor [Paraburkholderia caballeronis]TDV21825.1 methyl-accepting chemotaxis sensory transducer with Cache sensor [Paraburkholderia caballeronis]
MNHLTLKQKLWIPMLLCWLVLLIVTVVNAVQARSAQLAARYAALADVVDMSVSIAADYAKQVDAGKLSADDAKQQAVARIDAQRYGTSGYVSIVRDDKVLVDNPMSPKLNGKDMSQFRDAKGNALYQEIVDAGNSTGGAGYLRYWWPKPGETAPSEKVSYVKRFAPWNWNFIAGAYMDDIQAQFYSVLERSAVLLILLGGLASLVAARVVRSVIRSIGGEPANAAAVAIRIAQGDLSTNIELANGDQSSLLFSLREMRNQLAAAIGHIKTSAETITVASKQIAAGNLDLSSRTEEQAASLQETAASMDALTQTVTKNAENAETASGLAVDASDIATRSGQVVSDVAGKMADISDSSRKMSEIIGVIESIAFQTNILALNAAVEAARAGEEGRGFAVVAGEVRQLAQRCASAAKEIKALIDQSVSQVNEGSSLATRAGQTMSEAVTAVRRVAAIMGEISAASKQQSDGIGEVNLAIRQMDDVTQRNAALVEQAAAAAGSLDEQTELLRRTVSAFRVDAQVQA